VNVSGRCQCVDTSRVGPGGCDAGIQGQRCEYLGGGGRSSRGGTATAKSLCHRVDGI